MLAISLLLLDSGTPADCGRTSFFLTLKHGFNHKRLKCRTCFLTKNFENKDDRKRVPGHEAFQGCQHCEVGGPNINYDIGHDRYRPLC